MCQIVHIFVQEYYNIGTDMSLTLSECYAIPTMEGWFKMPQI
jgi:hypothetical protein